MYCPQNIKFFYHRIDKRPPPVPVLTHNNPVPASPPNFLKIHFNISHLRIVLPSGLFPSGLPLSLPKSVFLP